tara:strand:- start:3554 stop:4222 length:669 start_codon:yes stop_codon:yes gene_type:complete
MEYIPKSRIRNEEAYSIIRGLSLPDELIDTIEDYYEEKINVKGDKSTFWMLLGVETCNLDSWARYCLDIFQRVFGKTSPYCKLMKILGNGQIAHRLDGWLCGNYPLEITDIQSISGKNMKIVGVFSKSADIKEYDSKQIRWRSNCGRKLPKSIYSSDKQYIATFIERLHMYLEYLEKNMIHFPVNNNGRTNDIILIISKIIKTKKMVLNKLSSMIDNIPIKH